MIPGKHLGDPFFLPWNQQPSLSQWTRRSVLQKFLDSHGVWLWWRMLNSQYPYSHKGCSLLLWELHSESQYRGHRNEPCRAAGMWDVTGGLLSTHPPHLGLHEHSPLGSSGREWHTPPSHAVHRVLGAGTRLDQMTCVGTSAGASWERRFSLLIRSGWKGALSSAAWKGCHLPSTTGEASLAGRGWLRGKMKNAWVSKHIWSQCTNSGATLCFCQGIRYKSFFLKPLVVGLLCFQPKSSWEMFFLFFF